MQPTPPHFHSAPLALMVALALGTPGLVHAQAANTDNKTVALSIAAQPLSAALHELSAATGTAIGFSPALVAGKTAHAAKGTLTVQQAIDQLLLGTALIAVWEGDSIIVKAESASTGPVTQLETVTIKARTDSTTEGTDSLTTRTVSINKGDQAIKDIPQSISVITRKQLDEQGIVDLRDAANTVTGAVGVKGVGQGMVLSARGFQINDWQYDGVAVPAIPMHSGIGEPKKWFSMTDWKFCVGPPDYCKALAAQEVPSTWSANVGQQKKRSPLPLVPDRGIVMACNWMQAVRLMQRER